MDNERYFGGARPRKTARRCCEETVHPSGRKRCVYYAPSVRHPTCGGARKAKRKCCKETVHPSGRRRCAYYAPTRGHKKCGGALYGDMMIPYTVGGRGPNQRSKAAARHNPWLAHMAQVRRQLGPGYPQSEVARIARQSYR